MHICQLDDNDSNYYHDGTKTTDGFAIDTFMKLPCFSIKTEESQTGVWDISFKAGVADDPWVTYDGKDLIGAYKGNILSSNELYSLKGSKISNYISQKDARTYARNRGEGFSLVKWKHHCIMAFLYYAMYGNTDCKSTIGSGLSFDTTGGTASIGMTDTVAGGNGDNGIIKFWGLESWWGGKVYFEWIDNCVYNFGNLAVTEDDGSIRSVRCTEKQGYLTNMAIGKYLDVATRSTSYNKNTGYCEWVNTDADHSDQVAIRGNSDDKTGVASFSTVFYDSYSTSSTGARLAFRPSADSWITEVKDVSTFKRL